MSNSFATCAAEILSMACSMRLCAANRFGCRFGLTFCPTTTPEAKTPRLRMVPNTSLLIFMGKPQGTKYHTAVKSARNDTGRMQSGEAQASHKQLIVKYVTV